MNDLRYHPKYPGTPKLLKWGGVVFSSALVQIILYILDPKSVWWDYYKEALWIESVLSVLGGLVIYAIIFLIINYLSDWIEKRSIQKSSMFMHFVISTMLVLISMFFLLSLEDQLYEWFYPDSAPVTKEMEQAFRNYLVVNLIVAAFVNSFYNAFIFFEKWKSEVVESNKLVLVAHELKASALQSELEVLKLQLDPHFLFNSFSILTQLIQTDKEGALLFLANLSKVYRYILTNGKKDITTLEEELKFVFSYFHLIRIRHGAAVDLFVEVSENDRKKGIPPVTLQLLIENAIKHNIFTVQQPLAIKIESTGDGFINVINNLQRLHKDYKETGLGLENIQKRFELLSDRKPEFVETDNQFIIRLPLLNF